MFKIKMFPLASKFSQNNRFVFILTQNFSSRPESFLTNV